METTFPCSVLLAPALPLIAAPLSALKPKHPVLFRLLITLISLTGIYNAIRCGTHSQPESIGPFLKFVFDKWSYVFVILVNTGWLLTMIFSTSYIRYNMQKRIVRFHIWMATSVAAAISVGVAGNLITMFLFYLLSILPIYPLIKIRGNQEDKNAADFYLKSTLIPPLLIALPVAWIHFPMITPFGAWSISALGYSPVKASLLLALMIIGLSKNSLIPFHLWLPKSSIAPTPVTALLHSVVVIQAAVIVIVRIADQVYGSEFLISLNDHFFETGWLTWLCGTTAVYTAWRALKTTDLKRRFTFSTVGQLSYMITAILVGTHHAISGAVLHMLTHAISKLNLLFATGVFSTVIGTTQAPAVARWIPHHRWLGYACVLSGLSITGFPFLAGYYSKDIMLLEEIHRHHYAAAVFLVIGSVINFFYIIPIIKATLFGKKDPTVKPGEIPWTMKAAIIGNVVISLLLSKYIFFIRHVVG